MAKKSKNQTTRQHKSSSVVAQVGGSSPSSPRAPLTGQHLLERFFSMLATPVDGASLAVARIAFGAVMALQASSVLSLTDPSGNWATTYFTGDHVVWNFPYPGFEWLRALPAGVMNLVGVLMGLAALSLAIGFYHRLASAILFLTWTYTWMLDEGLFNNHYYLMSLVAWLLIFMPASERYSAHDWIRSRLGFSSPEDKTTPTGSVPFWTLFLLRSQLFVVYFYGGVSKICWQWLVHAEPVGMGLRQPIVAERLQKLPAGLAEFAQSLFATQEFAFFIAYSGLIFDLAIGFLLIIRRTRIFGILLVLLFHAFNHFVLFDDIGWFPLMGVLLTLIFLEPDWPTRFWNGLRNKTWIKPDWGWLLGGMLAMPLVGAALGWKRDPTPPPTSAPKPARLPGYVAVLVCGWVLVQVLLPLQHFTILGDVNWTAEGGRLSWRMKIAHKESPSLRFHLVDRALLTYDQEGKPLVDWQAWQGPKILYRQVNARSIDWRTMPEWIVFFQPLYGECIFFNPWAGQSEAPLSVEEASEKIYKFWKKTYGRQPKLYNTDSLPNVLDYMGQRLEKENAPQSLQNQVWETHELASRVHDPNCDTGTLSNLLPRLHENLRKLILVPDHGPNLRLFLSRTHPMASQGALDPQVPFISVEDLPLMVLSPKGFVVLQRNRFGTPWEGSKSVYCDLYHSSFYEWAGFPKTMLIVDEHGKTQLHWNHRAELMKFQCVRMRDWPYLTHQYAQRVADQWQQMYGRRPHVYVTSQASLVPGPLRSLIDPRVDMARAKIRYLSHNDWILLYGKQGKSPLE